MKDKTTNKKGGVMKRISGTLAESPAVNAFFGTWALIVIDLILGWFTKWSIFPDITYMNNPSYDPDMGAVWLESCGYTGVPYGDVECSWYDANSPTIVDPNSQDRIWYIWAGVAFVIYMISKVHAQKQQINKIKKEGK